MTLRNMLKKMTACLKEAGVDAYDYDARALLSSATGRDRLKMILDSDQELTAEEEERALEFLKRRETREPLQYILGETWFMGLRFLVTPDVLIPRADTEILVEEAQKRLPTGGTCLDIGTGSGAIAISLASLRPDATVAASDISDAALKIAAQNAEALGVRIDFIKGNCLAPVKNMRYDMIVSNPPYISEKERPALSPEVLQEPASALFDGGDGLSFYRKIIASAPQHLNRHGTLMFEIGFAQKDAVASMLKPLGEVFALRDYGQNWRVVGCCLK